MRLNQLRKREYFKKDFQSLKQKVFFFFLTGSSRLSFFTILLFFLSLCWAERKEDRSGESATTTDRTTATSSDRNLSCILIDNRRSQRNCDGYGLGSEEMDVFCSCYSSHDVLFLCRSVKLFSLVKHIHIFTPFKKK